jgi:penicillin-binding protein 1C
MVNAFSKTGKAKSFVGGSTLTQQVIRLSRNGQGRTYFEKIIELFATRLELGYSKNEF